MAVNFLDNLDLNDNQLLNARLQNLASDPGSANAGDIIYNSTSNQLKYYNGTGWIAVPDGTGISGSGTVGTIPVFVTNATTLGDSALETTGSGSSMTFTFNTTGSTSFKGNVNIDSGGIVDSNSALGSSGQLLSSTGSQVAWINAPTSYTKWIIGKVGGNTADVNDGDKYEIGESSTLPGILPANPSKSSTTITQEIGLHTKNMTLAAPSAYSTDVLLWGTNTTGTTWKVQQTHVDDIPVSAWGKATTSVNMDSNKIINVTDPTAGQDAATKAYVDGIVAGGFSLKGGFNANTGAIVSGGNLTSGGSRVAIAVGDFYVVTVAGNFFGNTATPLTPGDSVLVQTAAAAGASVEGDFVVIQSDTDLATISTVGIGNTNIEGSGIKDGLSLGYSSGTATVGLDITSLPGGSLNTTCVAAFADPDDTNTNIKASVTEIASGLNSVTSVRLSTTNQTTHTFTHNLDTNYVMVQLYDSSTLETVYASVDRTSTNVVTATTAASASLVALISKVGA